MAQKSQKNRLKCACIAVLAFLFTALTVFSAALAFPLTANAEESSSVGNCASFVLYDKTHQKYVVEKNGFEVVSTSTSAKVTMGLVACEKLADRLDEKVTVTAEMISESSGNSMKLKAGEIISIRDLLYGAICGSYNDAAYVLAHVISGSTRSFVELMNARALGLGAKSTHYENPIGYPDHTAMVTTAYDTLKIALAASENKLYMEISSALKHTVSATNMTSDRQFYNRNYLVSAATTDAYHNSKCSGMNAGISSDSAGWSIITHAKDDGAEYICVLLGGNEGSGERNLAYDEVNKHINYTCNKYNSYTVYKAGTVLTQTKVAHTSIATNDAPCATKEDVVVYIPTDGGAQLKTEIQLSEDIKAPISAGTVVGKVIVTMDGKKVGEGDIVLTESYEANGFMSAMSNIGGYTKSRAFILTVIFFVVFTSIAVFLRYTRPNFFTKTKYKKYK